MFCSPSIFMLLDHHYFAIYQCRQKQIEAKAIILGQSDLYVKMGSKINLTCVISQGPHDLGTISWYRGEYLNYRDSCLLCYFFYCVLMNIHLVRNLHNGNKEINFNDLIHCDIRTGKCYCRGFIQAGLMINFYCLTIQFCYFNYIFN